MTILIMNESGKSQIKTTVWVVENGEMRSHSDRVAAEEPLEIRLVAGSKRQTIAVTMRSPGNDFDLAAGFLYSEGVISSRQDISRMTYCVDRNVEKESRYNIVNVELSSNEIPNFSQLERHFYTTSACGVCGKTSLEALRMRSGSAIASKLTVTAEVLLSLPEQLRSHQRIFAATGGLHAAALFDREGNLLALREDVGRHNALDKLVGWALLSSQLSVLEGIVMVSGRSSFEILQKCLNASVPIVCAVSAPSSLAVQIAKEFGVTLIGFLRGEKFNIYAGRDRVILKPHIN